MKVIFLLALIATIKPALSQTDGALPTTTPAAMASPVATTTPATSILTPTATPTPTTAAPSPPSPKAASSPPLITTPPSAVSPPPALQSPPPPPGEGSQKTAVLSVIKLTGNGLKTFNSTLGDKFIAAMAQTYGISNSSVVIRSWGSNGRRLLSDTVTVGSAALFSNGMQAASGLATLNSAANSGALQGAFEQGGLGVDSLSLDSAVTALPSNFQPLYTSGHSRGLRTWVIVVVAVVAALLLVSVFLCCCWPYLCCCRKQREGEDEAKLPKMIKFGSMKDQGTMHFYSSQKFKPTVASKGRPLPEAPPQAAAVSA